MLVFTRIFQIKRRGCWIARQLALALMFAAAVFQPVAAMAELRPRACLDLFIASDSTPPPAVLQETIRGLLQNSNVDLNRRVYRKFLRNLEHQDQVGRMNLARLAAAVAKEQVKNERRENPRGLERVTHPFLPSVLMENYYREEIVYHGYIGTLEKMGLLRDSGDVEKFRLFLRQYDIPYLALSYAMIIPVAVIHGPLSFSVALSVMGTPLPLLRSRPIPPELLAEAIEKGFPAVQERLVEHYGDRARALAVQKVLEIAVYALFAASLIQFGEVYSPWISLVFQSLVFTPTDEDIKRVHQKLGLELRVEIQLESWADAYREFHGRAPERNELETKRREIHEVLSQP